MGLQLHTVPNYLVAVKIRVNRIQSFTTASEMFQCFQNYCFPEILKPDTEYLFPPNLIKIKIVFHSWQHSFCKYVQINFLKIILKIGKKKIDLMELTLKKKSHIEFFHLTL